MIWIWCRGAIPTGTDAITFSKHFEAARADCRSIPYPTTKHDLIAMQVRCANNQPRPVSSR